MSADAQLSHRGSAAQAVGNMALPTRYDGMPRYQRASVFHRGHLHTLTFSMRSTTLYSTSRTRMLCLLSHSPFSALKIHFSSSLLPIWLNHCVWLIFFAPPPAPHPRIFLESLRTLSSHTMGLFPLFHTLACFNSRF
jgi:hypothetical protein